MRALQAGALRVLLLAAAGWWWLVVVVVVVVAAALLLQLILVFWCWCCPLVAVRRGRGVLNLLSCKPIQQYRSPSLLFPRACTTALRKARRVRFQSQLPYQYPAHA